MTLPLYDNGVASGLLSGVLFGYVLENAGFASPRKLTAQFRFNDWSVFKVMFTAIIVAATGLYAAKQFGWLQANGVYIPTTFVWAMLTGGALIGAGMAVGGYCPGTSTVALATGRFDGLAFMIGMVAGNGLFASAFESIKRFYYAAEGPRAQTLEGLSGLPTWAILLFLFVVAIAGFALGTRLERALGGPLTAEQLNGDENQETIAQAEILEIRAG